MKGFLLTAKDGQSPQVPGASGLAHLGAELHASHAVGEQFRVHLDPTEALARGGSGLTDPREFPPKTWIVEIPEDSFWEGGASDSFLVTRLSVLEEYPREAVIGAPAMAFISALADLGPEGWWRLAGTLRREGREDEIHAAYPYLNAATATMSPGENEVVLAVMDLATYLVDAAVSTYRLERAITVNERELLVRQCSQPAEALVCADRLMPEATRDVFAPLVETFGPRFSVEQFLGDTLVPRPNAPAPPERTFFQLPTSTIGRGLGDGPFMDPAWLRPEFR